MTSEGKLIETLPKAELHIHIEGSLEPEMMFRLAKRNQIELRFKSAEELRKAYQFHNLQSFLDIYYEGVSVLQKEEDFYDMALAYFEKAATQHVKHAEIFFDPQSHTSRGVAFETVVSGLHRASKDAQVKFGITSKLILCFLRHLSEDDAQKTLDEAIPFRSKIVAVGLDSSEVGNPPTKFKRVFARAQQNGFLTVAHAGEEAEPDYIWQALDELGVSRIDHGVQCMKDATLVKRLAREKMPLTVCPLSNVKLRVFDVMKDHHLKRMLDRGLWVTINSDDPAYFGGYVNENYVAVQKELGLSTDELKQLAHHSFAASFLTPEEKN